MTGRAYCGENTLLLQTPDRESPGLVREAGESVNPSAANQFRHPTVRQAARPVIPAKAGTPLLPTRAEIKRHRKAARPVIPAKAGTHLLPTRAEVKRYREVARPVIPAKAGTHLLPTA